MRSQKQPICVYVVDLDCGRVGLPQMRDSEGRGLGRPTSTRNVVMAFFRHFSLKTTIESYFVSQ